MIIFLFLQTQGKDIERLYADTINTLRTERGLQPFMVVYGKIPREKDELEKVRIFSFRSSIRGNMGRIIGHLEQFVLDTTFDRLYVKYIPSKKNLRIAFARSRAGRKTEVNIQEFERKIFRSLNDYRSRNGLSTLLWNENLHELAEEHSGEMVMMGKLSHRDFDRRFSRSEYRRCVENLAAVPFSYSPDDVVRLWSGSMRHRKNMMNRDITYGAIGIDTTGNRIYVTFIGCGN